VSLTESVRQYAYELGADLVGFGGIDRCRHAPIMMSPQGLFPGARTVIVMALHHPDACIELGGEEHPQEIGPYSVQYLMNSRLDEMAYRLGTYVERQGYGAMPVASSNIWRYNQYKDLNAIFAPDVSHIYLAVVAGLAEIGYNGLALTPEYGARNRFVTVITDAVLEPDPLLPPGTVCDRCMLCRQHCPTLALEKEIDGEKVLKIGDFEYRFPNKNLWRCAWGEHFDLDLDLKIPELVTEEVILENVRQHGSRAGEMGQCLKFCLPKALRTFDRTYSKTPLRKYGPVPNETAESRAVSARLLARAYAGGAEDVIVSGTEALRQAGIEPDAILPGAKGAITLVVTCPSAAKNDEFWSGAQYQVDSLCYDLTRSLEELGFRSLMTIARSGSHPREMAGGNPTGAILAALPEYADREAIANTVVTRKTLLSRRRLVRDATVQWDCGDATADLTRHLSDLARQLGADLVGAASAACLDAIAGQLRPFFDGEEVLDAHDRSSLFTPWEPEVTSRRRRVMVPTDHLAGAKSVLVFGLRLHREVLRWATRPPAEAVGPYAFQTYVTHWLGAVIGYRLIKRLEELGHAAVLTTDLTGTDSYIASPRGPQPDLFSNRFAGLAAGLGYLTTSGHLATPQFGLRQRLIAIVTDAPLTPSPLYAMDQDRMRCATCSRPCITSCPAQAFAADRISLTCEGHTYSFNRIDGRRCDWVKRYALQGDGGFKYLGSRVDLPAPAEITPDALASALRQHDPIKKYRPVAAEPCVLNCPLSTDA